MLTKHTKTHKFIRIRLNILHSLSKHINSSKRHKCITFPTEISKFSLSHSKTYVFIQKYRKHMFFNMFHIWNGKQWKSTVEVPWKYRGSTVEVPWKYRGSTVGDPNWLKTLKNNKRNNKYRKHQKTTKKTMNNHKNQKIYEKKNKSMKSNTNDTTPLKRTIMFFKWIVSSKITRN